MKEMHQSPLQQGRVHLREGSTHDPPCDSLSKVKLSRELLLVKLPSPEKLQLARHPQA